jgi:hypothetical protein
VGSLIFIREVYLEVDLKSKLGREKKSLAFSGTVAAVRERSKTGRKLPIILRAFVGEVAQT